MAFERVCSLDEIAVDEAKAVDCGPLQVALVRDGDVRGDSASGGERHSAVEVDLPRGSYFVVVDGYGADASGTYRLRVDRALAP